MSMFWPEIKNDNKTISIFDFIEKLKVDLEETYSGKLHGDFHKVVYNSSISESMKAISKVFSSSRTVLTEEDIKKYANKEEIEMSSVNRYKFIIYSEKNFYRLFDVSISEFFPIKVFPGWEIDGLEKNFIEIHNEQQFENEILSMLKCEFVRNLITKMLDNLK